jgi:hypothetical protein
LSYRQLLKCEAADVVSDFRVAPDRRPQIGNGSTSFAFHAKGVAAIALRNRDLVIEPERRVQPIIANRNRTSHQSTGIRRRPPNLHEWYWYFGLPDSPEFDLKAAKVLGLTVLQPMIARLTLARRCEQYLLYEFTN